LISQYKKAVSQLNKSYMKNRGIAYLEKYYSIAYYVLQDCPTERDFAFEVSKFVKEECLRLSRGVDAYNDLYWATLLLEAPHRFDSYLLYLEKNRERCEKFYEPKIRQLNKHGIIQGMQDLEDDKLDRVCISMPPGTQKTTCEKFFASWIAGKYPNPSDFSLFFSHSGDITRKFYDGVLDIVTSSEYAWSEIFPNCKVTSTNAKMEEFNINKFSSYSTLQCSSVGSKNAGKVRASRYLYCDDLIGGIEEALNPAQLEKIWRIYGVDLKQRKLNEKVKEVMIMTRWSVMDPIGRIIDLYGDSDRTRIIAIPDIDPNTGESNFDYEFNGMSVEFFHDQALTMDEISYRCLYKSDPIEREGLLFPEDSLRRYLVLPDTNADEITAQVDCKDSGTDFMVLPVFKKYRDDYYLVDVLCSDDSDYEHHYKGCADILFENNVQNCEFETNQGGGRVAFEVSQRLDNMGHICNITTRYTESNKEARIFQCSSWIKQHIIFKDKSLYSSKSAYGIFMEWLLKYSVSGKNVHDDVPDVLSNFAIRMKMRERNHGPAQIMSSPI